MKQLSLGDNPITDRALKHLSGLTELEHLELNGTQVSGTGLLELNAPKLRKLSLHRTSVNDEGLQTLSHFPKLEWLDRVIAEVTEQGLDVLRQLPDLQFVDLRGGSLDPAVVRDLKINLPRTLR